ncbi:hypothetical protein [Mesorhizobium sp.]|uniref:hypothetical protein n=1 Tax=Mesorhizobium sp. TaxID=1871066 RepID=UPI001222735E|nr:hypothetical protein [Mesorhizobium sp.]TIQ99470.1 MAG: hypothetical protein E5X36_08785 [Mesorhizobium sp.]
MVEHFVSLALLINENPGVAEAQLSRHKSIFNITALAFVLAIALAGLGIWLVALAGDDADTKIHILGSSVETNSAGIACFGLSALLFLFVARKALSRL